MEKTHNRRAAWLYAFISSGLAISPAILADAPDHEKSCVGVSRVLELFAEKAGDQDAQGRYGTAKNAAIQAESLTPMDAVGVVMSEMAEAALTRKSKGLTADETRDLYKAEFDRRCGPLYPDAPTE